MVNKIKEFYKRGYGIEAPNPLPFIQKHNKNKAKIADMIGNNGRLEFDIDVVISNKEFKRILDIFVSKYPELKKAVNGFKKVEIINNKNYLNKDFPIGMKISKILSKIIGVDSEQMLIDYSMLIQESKTVGTIVITTNLMEMLTASMNNKGWTSCLNLDDGYYRGGLYSYILDNTTFLAYLKSSKTMINGVKVDDKRWRQFIHINFDENQIYFSKNYPYTSTTLSTLVRTKVESLLAQYQDIKNEWLSSKDLHFIKKGVEDKGLTFDYNDILLSNENIVSSIRAVYHKKGNSTFSMEIGTLDIICPTCGENIVSSEDMIVCDKCDELVQCNNCKDYIWKSATKNGLCVECQ